MKSLVLRLKGVGIIQNKNNFTHSPDQTDGTGPGPEHPCEGCLHYYGCYESTKCCNYIFDMDMRRPCPAGKGCTVKREITSKKDLKLRKAIGFLGYTI